MAQRLKHGIRKRERDFERRICFQIREVKQLEAFYGLPSLVCSLRLCVGLRLARTRSIRPTIEAISHGNPKEMT